jgi:hydroxylamine dehydrogenase
MSKEKSMSKKRCFIKAVMFASLLIFPCAAAVMGDNSPISEDTQTCIDCHASATPGVIDDWEKSRMAETAPRQALMKDVPGGLANVVVGCAECHTMRAERHEDTFSHNDFQVHVVVTPADCAVCHATEANQYGKNLMSHAYGNLQGNPVYHALADSVNSIESFDDMKVSYRIPDMKTNADSCFYCHGTVVQVKGLQTRETEAGAMKFPVLAGWPNQGAGRINPDGTKGSCTACHTRHRFSIETARKPHTCAECHKGPDVPAYKVYMASKHGNIYSSQGNGWNFDSIPWTVGKDFSAPTCATCHISLTTTGEGEVLSERTHQMNDRIPWRIFGLIYAHPHPKSPDTTIILNAAGLALPTELTGEPASKYLIDAVEQQKRLKTMKQVCLACHSNGWVDGQFDRFENTLNTTNEMTLTATKVLFAAWEKGVAKGPAQKDSIFNEAIEKKWVEQWLFYANSTRYSSAMIGADYGVFANGRWTMSKNIQDMVDWVEFKLKKKD